MSRLRASAAERLTALQGRRPDAVRLARVAALAVRIEPHLLRRLRLDCVPDADVSAEADLWFSPLVESRGTGAIVLQSDVARLLREDLARDRTLLARVVAIMADAHRYLADALRLEERITALALLDGDAAVAGIDEALRPAVRGMTESEARGREIARWWMRAAPRLPSVVWQSENAHALLLRSSLSLRRAVLDGVVPPPGPLQNLAWALPEASRLPHLEIGLEWRDDHLRFVTPTDGGSTIRVPRLDPPVVEVSWTTGGRSQRTLIAATPGEEVALAAGVDHVSIETIVGALYEVHKETAAMSTRTCFVSMGFGRQTDFETGRTLDLDRTYRDIIKPAAEEAGLSCFRADEIVHQGVIDAPVFRQLLEADVAIFDLSTSNLRVAYELGIRHALRPSGTIVIAERQLRSPFDSSVAVIRDYEHLGNDIDFEEAVRMRRSLVEAIGQMLDGGEVDSPVYTFLRELSPPVLTYGEGAGVGPGRAAAVEPDAGGSGQTPAIASLLREADEAMRAGDFAKAKALLQAARATTSARGAPGLDDAYVIQRLALATYKSRMPSPQAALEEALALLAPLSPETSNDPETLGLYGGIQKQLWELTRSRPHLDAAVRGYERGFYLRRDHYNGVNLAFMLNVRATVSEPAEAVADFVQAQRIRRQVIDVCEGLLREAGQPGEDRFWVIATLAESWLGLGDKEQAERWLGEATSTAPSAWMLEATREQLAKLEPLLQSSPLQRFSLPGTSSR